jgi:hypothetical protein
MHRSNTLSSINTTSTSPGSIKVNRNRVKNIKKRVIVLPPNYQEVLILHEIEFSKGVNVDIIRKMVYLYSVEILYIFI